MTLSNDLPKASPAQIQALTNEYKGHVFEYLVAQLLAQRYGVEKDFLDHFGGEIKQRLIHYESWLRQVQPDLLPRLCQNARALVNDPALKESVLPAQIKRVLSMGKTAQSHQYKAFEEADILLIDHSDQLIPVSIKLTAQGSTLHTKSAGVKSFFTQYFKLFDDALLVQQNLNQACHQAYSSMCLDLLALAGLESYSQSDNFATLWAHSGFSELPGGLDEKMKERLHQCYFEMSQALLLGLEKFLQQDTLRFGQALLPLFGLGLTNMVQLTCFELPGGLSQVSILTREDCEMAMKSGFSIDPRTRSHSSIYLRLDGLRLGLRIKPMSRFTQPGFKVNCSYSKTDSRD